MEKVVEAAQALALAIRASEPYIRMHEADSALQKDEEASRKIALYRDKEKLLAAMMQREDDFGPGELETTQAELEALNTEIGAMSIVKDAQAASEAFTNMMNSVNQILAMMLNGDPNGECTGSCATCGGCGQN